MNGSDLYDLLEKIAATSSRTEKENLVRANMGEGIFVWALKAALDPFVTYGIIPPRPVEATHTGHMDLAEISNDVLQGLRDLASRESTGNHAKELVQALFNTLDWKSAEVVWRIICKDLKAGFTEGTVNRVAPGTIPVFEVMLSHKFEEKRIKSWPVAAEPKMDGVRVIAIVKDEAVKFVSRNGKEFPAMAHMAKPVLEMIANAWRCAGDAANASDSSCGLYHAMLGGSAGPALILEGEMVSGSFNKTVGDVRRKSEQATDAVYCVFDALPYEDFLADKQFGVDASRRHFTEFVVAGSAYGAPIKLIDRRLCHNVDEIQEFYAEVRAAGGEGLIVKPLEGRYEKKRSYNWLKMKNEETIDVVVTGAFEGEPHTKYAGMLGGVIVNVDGVEVRVGGGLSDKQREEFWAAYLRDQARVAANMDPFELLGRLVEVEFHEKTPDGSLRHPRFVRFRDDKQRAAA